MLALRAWVGQYPIGGGWRARVQARFLACSRDRGKGVRKRMGVVMARKVVR